ncbi:MAG: hypothetical protein H8E14_18485 [Candidatus Marinimicrobia bacterium]|nr:hypothetical protein [Candidatus Neomarinimicrobiota bacterium]
MQPIRLLALDFDGVIVDSVLECAVVAYNGFQAYQGLDSRIKSPQDIPVNTLREFRSMRSFIRSGEDYLYLFQAMDEGITIADQRNFDEFQDTHLDRKELYYQLFYAEREALSISDHESWMLLNPFFPEITKLIIQIAHWSGFYFVSTKATRYIYELLNFNGISVNQRRIRQAGPGKSKPNIICELLDEIKAIPEEAYFIDDHPDTVKKVVKETGVFGLIASWGYNNPEQCYASSGKNISSISIKEFLILFRESLL